MKPVNARQAELEQVLAEYLPKQEREPPKKSTPPGSDTGHAAVSAQQVLDQIRKAKNAPKFEELFNGSLAGHPSPSEACRAILKQLIFYTENARTLDEIMRQSSGAWNGKWDAKRRDSTWGADEIAKALGDYEGEHYDWAKHKGEQREAKSETTPDDEDPTGFAARVGATFVNLIERIRQGIPPIDYLPASEGMLVRGRRHQITAPKKEGKSLAMLVHWVTMALAGATVAILDRENGADLYARRLEAIIDALGLEDEEREEIAERLLYYEFPRLRTSDADELVEFFTGADLVVFDSQRMFLTDLGLTENSADDFATFAVSTIDPLFRNGIASAMLDNTGHTDEDRSRGTAAKGDLFEVLLKLKAKKKFDLETEGLVRLTITATRFGNTGSWDMRIGGGHFEGWRARDREDLAEERAHWRPTGLMEKVSRFVEAHFEPVSKGTVKAAKLGKTEYVVLAMDALIKGGYLKATEGANRTDFLSSIKAYREADVQADWMGESPS